MKPINTTIDATGKAVGRVASAAALLLQGKHKPTYAPNKDEGDAVTITNARAIKWTGRKLEQKEYHRTSDFQGGLKTRKASEMFANSPIELVRHAVYTMLPNNRLRPARMKRLTVKI